MTKQEQLEAKQRELEELEAKQAKLKAEITKLEGLKNGYLWVPKLGDRYLCVDVTGDDAFPCWKDSPYDRFALSVGNVFYPDDLEGAENHKLFRQSVVPSCAFEDVAHVVRINCAIRSRHHLCEDEVRCCYLLGRGFDSLAKAEAWRELYHEVQLRKCGG